MDSGILRWLLLIVAVLVLALWYMRYLLSSRRAGRCTLPEAEDSATDTPDTLMGDKLENQKTAQELSPDNLIAIAVDGKNGQELRGADIVELLAMRGLAFGKYSIYHRHIQSEGSERLVYSVINGIEPGYLDDDFVQTTTPSIMFFLDASRAHNPLKAFSEMLEAAQDIASRLSATVCDSDHNPLTEQTIGYIRKTISDKERSKQLQSSQ